MKTRTPQDWSGILVQCGVKLGTSARWAPAFSEELRGDALSAGDAELDDFLGQILHESDMLEKVEESLYYRTPGRLMVVWPTRFHSLSEEMPYLCNPNALANKVYGGRMGNVEPNDGWKFRGRGLVMVTGRDNYRLLSHALGVDLIENPDMLKQPATALRASVRWWEQTLPDALMLTGDLLAVTKRVNGGFQGLDHRRQLTEAAARALE